MRTIAKHSLLNVCNGIGNQSGAALTGGLEKMHVKTQNPAPDEK
jgi:hypothetical protein